MYTYTYTYIYRICTSCREREANMYADVHNICLTYTPAHAWCATTPENACRLCAKNVYGLMNARLFNCAAASLPWRLLQTYLESCVNIVQAVVYCPPYRPPSCRQSVARRVRSRNSSKSTLAHNAGPLRCCTSIIRSSALVQTSTSLFIGGTCAWPRRLPVTEMHFRHFSREFLTRSKENDAHQYCAARGRLALLYVGVWGHISLILVKAEHIAFRAIDSVCALPRFSCPFCVTPSLSAKLCHREHIGSICSVSDFNSNQGQIYN